MSWITTITDSLVTLSTITGSLFFTTLVTVPTPIPGVDENPRYYWYQDPCSLTPNGNDVVLSTGGSGMGCWIQMYPYQVQPDWSATSGLSFIRNKPSLFNGSYLSLSNVPATFAPSAHTHAYSSLTGLPSFATVATSGSYTDLINKPTIPAAAPVLQRIRAQTNTSGVYTWTFPQAFASTPVVGVTVEDASSATWNHQITSISASGVTVQLTKTNAVTLLGISVLGVATSPQAFVHLTAVAP